MVLRLAGLVCSVFYGPYIYLVLCLSSLLLAGDFSLVYMEATSQFLPLCFILIDELNSRQFTIEFLHHLSHFKIQLNHEI